MKTLKDLQKEFRWEFDTYNGLKEAAKEWIKALEAWENHLVDKGIPQEWKMKISSGELKPAEVLRYIFNLKEECCGKYCCTHCTYCYPTPLKTVEVVQDGVEYT